MDDKFTVVLFSYMPLVWGDPTINYIEHPNKIAKLMDEADGTAKCAIWYHQDGHERLVFAFDRAADIKKHLVEWSEGKPNAWFDLVAHQKDGMYSAVLMPKLDKSIERWRLQYQLLNGLPAPTNADFKICFKPLSFVNLKPSPMAANVKSFKGKKIRFGLIETSDIEKFISFLKGDEDLPSGLVHEVSTYKLKNETNAMIDDMIDGATNNFRKLS